MTRARTSIRLKEFRTIRAKTAMLLLSLALPAITSCGSAAPSHLGYVDLRGANGVTAYRINNQSAAFTRILGSPFPTGVSPASVWAHPSKRFVYVANQGENDISLLSTDSQTGALSEVLPRVHTGIFPASLGMDSGGTFLFAANEASSNISIYAINSGSGVLTEIAGSPFATGTNPVKLKVSPSGKFLYVLTPNLRSVYAYAITQGAGLLQPVAGSPFIVGISPSSFTIDSAEHFMFVTNASTSTVSVFAITPSGALIQIPGSPFATTTAGTSTIPVDVTVSPSGTNLYVLNSGPNNISEFSIGGTGALTLLTASPVGSSGTGPVFILFDSNPKFVFVGNQGSNNISVFSVNSDGTLASIQTPGTLGASPSSMFVLP